MKGLFCGGCKAKNNDEYRIVLKHRQRRIFFIIAAGVLTVVFSLIFFTVFKEVTDDFRLGVLTGIGTGLAAGGIIAALRIQWILSDEDRLKGQRLRETDEREVEAGNQALRATAKVMLAVFYVFMILGIAFSKEMLEICETLICIFLVSYLLFLWYYRRVM
ncbi:MAG: hypothetical protein UFG06_02665 [Lachnospiraceae bacterium]|nr:hypothetical protein [Lachnospiraceae bacterium]